MQSHSNRQPVAVLAWSVLCYVVFFACFLYAVAFVGNLPVVPKTIDSGTLGPLGAALAVNLGLLSLFAVQHTGMARRGFKRVWTRIVPAPAERATYVLLSSLCLAGLFAFWQPIGGTLWQVTGLAHDALMALYFGGWALLLYSTMLIDHFDLFGLRQGWAAFRGRDCPQRPFTTPGLYRHIRHPIYLSWAIIFWATPEMSVGHLLFAAVSTAYMGLAVLVEERDLVHQFGDAYRRYQETTPRYLPRLVRAGGRRKGAVTG